MPTKPVIHIHRTPTKSSPSPGPYYSCQRLRLSPYPRHGPLPATESVHSWRGNRNIPLAIWSPSARIAGATTPYRWFTALAVWLRSCRSSSSRRPASVCNMFCRRKISASVLRDRSISQGQMSQQLNNIQQPSRALGLHEDSAQCLHMCVEHLDLPPDTKDQGTVVLLLISKLASFCAWHHSASIGGAIKKDLHHSHIMIDMLCKCKWVDP